MDDSVKVFLESGQLELYVHGVLSAYESAQVRDMIDRYPEVSSEYEALQAQLEAISNQQAMAPPPELKQDILSKIEEKEAHAQSAKQNGLFKWIAAASVIFGLACIGLLYKTNLSLTEAEWMLASNIKDCDKNQNIISRQQDLIAFLQSEQTKKYQLKGEKSTTSYNGFAYIDQTAGKLLLNTQMINDLPSDKCLQLWGDLEGEMIPIALLDKIYDTNIIDINPKYASLNLTIEDKTEDGKGQNHPDVSQLIANVLI